MCPKSDSDDCVDKHRPGEPLDAPLAHVDDSLEPGFYDLHVVDEARLRVGKSRFDKNLGDLLDSRPQGRQL